MPQFRVVWQERQLTAISSFRQLAPIAYLREPVDLVNAFQHRLPLHLIHFRATKKVVAPLHQRRFQIRSKMFLQEGHILIEELLLQRFRRRGNHHPPPATNRRDQVRQSFSRPGSGLDDGVLPLLKRFIHHLGHLELRGTVFIPRMAFLQQSARAENILNRHFLGLFSRSFFRNGRFRHLQYRWIEPLK